LTGTTTNLNGHNLCFQTTQISDVVDPRSKILIYRLLLIEFPNRPDKYITNKLTNKNYFKNFATLGNKFNYLQE
jgi:hypothetical protein